MNKLRLQLEQNHTVQDFVNIIKLFDSTLPKQPLRRASSHWSRASDASDLLDSVEDLMKKIRGMAPDLRCITCLKPVYYYDSIALSCECNDIPEEKYGQFLCIRCIKQMKKIRLIVPEDVVRTFRGR